LAGLPSADGKLTSPVHFCVAIMPTVMANDGSMATSWQCFELKLMWQMAMAENFVPSA
jgi:hypothetical protein